LEAPTHSNKEKSMKTLVTRILAKVLVPLALTCALALPMASKPAHAQYRTRLTNHLAGRWFREGRPQEPCTIFQQGSALILVNEFGSFATGRVVDAQTFVVIKGDGWDSGLQAVVLDGGYTIAWGNGTFWRR
jgi:hypothetical protein